MNAPMNIYQRLQKVMEEVDYVQKEAKQGMRYTIVSHDAVTAKVRPFLVKHGVVYHPADITVNQNGNRTEVVMVVRFACTDDPSYIDVPSLGYGIDDQDKGPGKAISYAVKYALLKTLGLETGDDPDTDQDVSHTASTLPQHPTQSSTSTSHPPTFHDGILPKDGETVTLHLMVHSAEMKPTATGSERWVLETEYGQMSSWEPVPLNTGFDASVTGKESKGKTYYNVKKA